MSGSVVSPPPVLCRVDFRLNRSISVARSDCGAESATARTFESQALEALNDLAKKKRAKASKSSPEKIQPLVPKLDLSLVQVCSALHATRCSTSHVGRHVIISLIESGF